MIQKRFLIQTGPEIVCCLHPSPNISRFRGAHNILLTTVLLKQQSNGQQSCEPSWMIVNVWMPTLTFPHPIIKTFQKFLKIQHKNKTFKQSPFTCLLCQQSLLPILLFNMINLLHVQHTFPNLQIFGNLQMLAPPHWILCETSSSSTEVPLCHNTVPQHLL